MLAALLAFTLSAIPAEAPRVERGTLVQNGRPLHAFGVNYVSAFTRVLANPSDDSYEAGFRELGRRGIPVARVWFMGYWPTENALYRTNRQEFFRRLDRVVAAAERHRVGLIPSLFFNSSCVPDLVGEPMDAWGEGSSKTRDFMRTFTREVVTRYRGRRAIWAWEFGNEMNLGADLPNAAEHRPPIAPSLGTPATRSTRDEWSHETIRSALRGFGQEVRRYDPVRPIISGNTFPRPTAWHQIAERSWRQDSQAQFDEVFRADSPPPLDTLSGHLYAGDVDRFGRRLSVVEFLGIAQETARRSRKPLIVGEYGTPGTGPEVERAFREATEALLETRVPLALLWVYDFSPQDADWNVTASNARSRLLDTIERANRRARQNQAFLPTWYSLTN